MVKRNSFSGLRYILVKYINDEMDVIDRVDRVLKPLNARTVTLRE